MKITVNGETISKEKCDQEIASTKRANPGLSDKEVKDLAAQSLIDWTIIKQEANKKVQVSQAETQNAYKQLLDSHGGKDQFFKKFNLAPGDAIMVIQDVEQNLKIGKFLEQLSAIVGGPDEQALLTCYNENKMEYTIPEQIHAAHIVKQFTPQNRSTVYREMLEIREKLLSGASFAETANTLSSCKDSGGDLGFFTPGKMVDEFDTIIFSLRENEISPVFITQFGYHIAVVYEKKAPELIPFEKCADDIKDKLHTDLKDLFIAGWVDNIKKNISTRISD